MSTRPCLTANGFRTVSPGAYSLATGKALLTQGPIIGGFHRASGFHYAAPNRLRPSQLEPRGVSSTLSTVSEQIGHSCSDCRSSSLTTNLPLSTRAILRQLFARQHSVQRRAGKIPPVPWSNQSFADGDEFGPEKNSRSTAFNCSFKEARTDWPSSLITTTTGCPALVCR